MELNDLIKTADDRQLLYVATFNGVMRVESARDTVREVKRALINAGGIGIMCDDPGCKCVNEVFAASKFLDPTGKPVKIEIVECALVRTPHNQVEVPQQFNIKMSDDPGATWETGSDYRRKPE